MYRVEVLASRSRSARPLRRLPWLAIASLVACGGETASGGPGDVCAPDAGTYAGEGTYYDADGTGNCGFPATPADLMVGAVNHYDYAGSAACGACAAIDGPDGDVTVRIVDRCPECAPGDIDLSPEAFAMIAPIDDGRVPITWRYVPCETTGPLVYHFKDHSNPWWAAVQIRNHRHPIATFEYLDDDGQFHALERLDYNYFVQGSGMGEGPFTFRVTDVTGAVVEDTGIPLLDDADAPSASQLAECAAP